MVDNGHARKYLVIINPASRGGVARKAAKWLLNQLKSKHVDHEFVLTEYPGHAEEIVVDRGGEFDVIVSAAGDGTINEIINGLMKVPSKDLKLSVFPLGTGDDFARNLGYRTNNRKQSLDAMLGKSYRSIDLIRYNDRYAAISFGIGVDSDIAREAYKWKVFRVHAYLYSGFRKFFLEGRKRYHVHFEYEDKTFDARVFIAILCNAPTIARYVKIGPHAKMNDGVLNLTIGREMPGIFGFFLFVLATMGGIHGLSRYVSFHELQRMRVECISSTYVQIDGEVKKFDQGAVIDLSVVPKALKVLVPKQSLRSRKLPFSSVP